MSYEWQQTETQNREIAINGQPKRESSGWSTKRRRTMLELFHQIANSDVEGGRDMEEIEN
jgi:hypothetical protein